jgi:hypothetical protein
MSLSLFATWIAATGLLAAGAIGLRLAYHRWREARILAEWDPY